MMPQQIIEFNGHFFDLSKVSIVGNLVISDSNANYWQFKIWIDGIEFKMFDWNRKELMQVQEDRNKFIAVWKKFKHWENRATHELVAQALIDE